MANGIPQLMTPPASSAFRSAITLAQGAIWDYLSTDVKWGLYYAGSTEQVILGQVKPSSISGILNQATSLSGAKALLNGELVANNVYIDSVMQLSVNKGSDLSNYRIETGSFTTFNKVEKPRQIKIRLIKGGKEEERGLFLTWLEKRAKGYSTERQRIKKTAPTYSFKLLQNNTFDIYMPEVHYTNMTLVDYTVSRETTNGAYVVIADCIFQEVREITFQYKNSKTSNAKNASDQPTTETISVLANTPSPNALSKLKSLASSVL